MSRTIRKAFLLFLACALIGPPAAAADYRWSGVKRVVAMSDPHGAFDSMVTTLKHAGIVDESGGWAGGSSHLVITGDLLDRGADSRRIMAALWPALAYRSRPVSGSRITRKAVA